MEKLIYEIRPYFFALGGIAAVVFRTNTMMLGFGFLLVAASAVVIQSRFKYRAWLASPH